MSRIELNDTVANAILKMSDGNPGAITAMSDILKEAADIDPQSAMGGMGPILMLDTWEIYGTDIYVLWSDKCQRDVRKMLMLLRATQLGFLNNSRLKEMASDQMRKIDLTEEEWDDLDGQVCSQLENFRKKGVH